MTAVSRFAPSPTGSLHIGSVRTALYSWLYAKHTKGKFILRVEDTDRERSTKEAIDIILDGMEWLGMDYEGPYYQTERMARYNDVIDQLLKEGFAYKCYCSKERVDKLREEQMANKQKPRYDGLCRDKEHQQNQKGPYVIRFKTPKEGSVVFNDGVRGEVVTQNTELDDLILVRADGYPTYNFAVVIDDMDMGITEVIRGEDHISNTPKQINIYKALKKNPPYYAHVPMILGSDGKKLSKRHGALSVLEYKEAGYLPEALLNYLLRLGFSAGDKEIFSIQEMIELFTISNVSKSAAAFDKEKLNWLNQHYIKTLPEYYVAKNLEYQFKKLNIDIANGPSLENLVAAMKERAVTLLEMAEKSVYFYSNDFSYNAESIDKHFTEDVKPAFEGIINKFKSIDNSNWTKENIKAEIKNTIKEFDIKMGMLAQPIRIATTGDTNSPSIDITLELIGKDRVIYRMEKSLVSF